MTAPRMRLNNNHPHMERFAKLCEAAEELGISIDFSGNDPSVGFDGDGVTYRLEDIEGGHNWCSEFPPTTEYKLTFVNPKYIAEQKRAFEDSKRKIAELAAQARADEERKMQEEAAERARQIEESERHELARLIAKYGAP